MRRSIIEKLYSEDITFSEFVLGCAYADKDYDVSQHHLTYLNNAKQRLAEIENWDDSIAEKQADAVYQSCLQSYKEAMAHNFALRRYESMLTRVKTWVPPNPSYLVLKDSMIRMLEENIEEDTYTPVEPQRMTGFEYKQSRMERLQEDIIYYTEKYEAALKYIKARAEWLRVLRESLSDTDAD